MVKREEVLGKKKHHHSDNTTIEPVKDAAQLVEENNEVGRQQQQQKVQNVVTANNNNDTVSSKNGCGLVVAGFDGGSGPQRRHSWVNTINNDSTTNQPTSTSTFKQQQKHQQQGPAIAGTTNTTTSRPSWVNRQQQQKEEEEAIITTTVQQQPVQPHQEHRVVVSYDEGSDSCGSMQEEKKEVSSPSRRGDTPSWMIPKQSSKLHSDSKSVPSSASVSLPPWMIKKSNVVASNANVSVCNASPSFSRVPSWKKESLIGTEVVEKEQQENEQEQGDCSGEPISTVNEVVKRQQPASSLLLRKRQQHQSGRPAPTWLNNESNNNELTTGTGTAAVVMNTNTHVDNEKEMVTEGKVEEQHQGQSTMRQQDAKRSWMKQLDTGATRTTTAKRLNKEEEDNDEKQQHQQRQEQVKRSWMKQSITTINGSGEKYENEQQEIKSNATSVNDSEVTDTVGPTSVIPTPSMSMKQQQSSSSQKLPWMKKSVILPPSLEESLSHQTVVGAGGLPSWMQKKQINKPLSPLPSLTAENDVADNVEACSAKDAAEESVTADVGVCTSVVGVIAVEEDEIEEKKDSSEKPVAGLSWKKKKGSVAEGEDASSYSGKKQQPSSISTSRLRPVPSWMKKQPTFPSNAAEMEKLKDKDICSSQESEASQESKASYETQDSHVPSQMEQQSTSVANDVVGKKENDNHLHSPPRLRGKPSNSKWMDLNQVKPPPDNANIENQQSEGQDEQFQSEIVPVVKRPDTSLRSSSPLRQQQNSSVKKESSSPEVGKNLPSWMKKKKQNARSGDGNSSRTLPRHQQQAFMESPSDEIFEEDEIDGSNKVVVMISSMPSWANRLAPRQVHKQQQNEEASLCTKLEAEETSIASPTLVLSNVPEMTDKPALVLSNVPDISDKHADKIQQVSLEHSNAASATEKNEEENVASSQEVRMLEKRVVSSPKPPQQQLQRLQKRGVPSRTADEQEQKIPPSPVRHQFSSPSWPKRVVSPQVSEGQEEKSTVAPKRQPVLPWLKNPTVPNTSEEQNIRRRSFSMGGGSVVEEPEDDKTSPSPQRQSLPPWTKTPATSVGDESSVSTTQSWKKNRKHKVVEMPNDIVPPTKETKQLLPPRIKHFSEEQEKETVSVPSAQPRKLVRSASVGSFPNKQQSLPPWMKNPESEQEKSTKQTEYSAPKAKLRPIPSFLKHLQSSGSEDRKIGDIPEPSSRMGMSQVRQSILSDHVSSPDATDDQEKANVLQVRPTLVTEGPPADTIDDQEKAKLPPKVSRVPPRNAIDEQERPIPSSPARSRAPSLPFNQEKSRPIRTSSPVSRRTSFSFDQEKPKQIRSTSPIIRARAASPTMKRVSSFSSSDQPTMRRVSSFSSCDQPKVQASPRAKLQPIPQWMKKSSVDKERHGGSFASVSSINSWRNNSAVTSQAPRAQQPSRRATSTSVADVHDDDGLSQCESLSILDQPKVPSSPRPYLKRPGSPNISEEPECVASSSNRQPMPQWMKRGPSIVEQEGSTVAVSCHSSQLPGKNRTNPVVAPDINSNQEDTPKWMMNHSCLNLEGREETNSTANSPENQTHQIENQTHQIENQTYPISPEHQSDVPAWTKQSNSLKEKGKHTSNSCCPQDSDQLEPSTQQRPVTDPKLRKNIKLYTDDDQEQLQASSSTDPTTTDTFCSSNNADQVNDEKEHSSWKDSRIDQENTAKEQTSYNSWKKSCHLETEEKAQKNVPFPQFNGAVAENPIADSNSARQWWKRVPNLEREGRAPADEIEQDDRWWKPIPYSFPNDAPEGNPAYTPNEKPIEEDDQWWKTPNFGETAAAQTVNETIEHETIEHPLPSKEQDNPSKEQDKWWKNNADEKFSSLVPDSKENGPDEEWWGRGPRPKEEIIPDAAPASVPTLKHNDTACENPEEWWQSGVTSEKETSVLVMTSLGKNNVHMQAGHGQEHFEYAKESGFELHNEHGKQEQQPHGKQEQGNPQDWWENVQGEKEPPASDAKEKKQIQEILPLVNSFTVQIPEVQLATSAPDPKLSIQTKISYKTHEDEYSTVSSLPSMDASQKSSKPPIQKSAKPWSRTFRQASPSWQGLKHFFAPSSKERPPSSTRSSSSVKSHGSRRSKSKKKKNQNDVVPSSASMNSIGSRKSRRSRSHSKKNSQKKDEPGVALKRDIPSHGKVPNTIPLYKPSNAAQRKGEQDTRSIPLREDLEQRQHTKVSEPTLIDSETATDVNEEEPADSKSLIRMATDSVLVVDYEQAMRHMVVQSKSYDEEESFHTSEDMIPKDLPPEFQKALEGSHFVFDESGEMHKPNQQAAFAADPFKPFEECHQGGGETRKPETLQPLPPSPRDGSSMRGTLPGNVLVAPFEQGEVSKLDVNRFGETTHHTSNCVEVHSDKHDDKVPNPSFSTTATLRCQSAPSADSAGIEFGDHTKSVGGGGEERGTEERPKSIQSRNSPGIVFGDPTTFGAAGGDGREAPNIAERAQAIESWTADACPSKSVSDGHSKSFSDGKIEKKSRLRALAELERLNDFQSAPFSAEKDVSISFGVNTEPSDNFRAPAIIETEKDDPPARSATGASQILKFWGANVSGDESLDSDEWVNRDPELTADEDDIDLVTEMPSKLISPSAQLPNQGLWRDPFGSESGALEEKKSDSIHHQGEAFDPFGAEDDGAVKFESDNFFGDNGDKGDGGFRSSSGFAPKTFNGVGHGTQSDYYRITESESRNYASRDMIRADGFGGFPPQQLTNAQFHSLHGVNTDSDTEI